MPTCRPRPTGSPSPEATIEVGLVWLRKGCSSQFAVETRCLDPQSRPSLEKCAAVSNGQALLANGQTEDAHALVEDPVSSRNIAEKLWALHGCCPTRFLCASHLPAQTLLIAMYGISYLGTSRSFMQLTSFVPVANSCPSYPSSATNRRW